MPGSDENPVPETGAPAPISLAGMGSFHIGGRRVEVHGFPVSMQQLVPDGVPARFDPNGGYIVEQMYVQYFVPQPLYGKAPLLLWHGGGMTGVAYETTPDGREGWVNRFLRWGWAVYNCDAVERGRAGWPALPARLWQSDPVLIPVEHAAERFRIGAPDGRFPVGALEQFGKQLAPRWTTTDEPAFKAYLQLVERVGPCVIVAHSQGAISRFGSPRPVPTWSAPSWRWNLPASAIRHRRRRCATCLSCWSTETTSSRTPAGRRCDSADLRLPKAFEAVVAAVTSSICRRAASGGIRTC